MKIREPLNTNIINKKINNNNQSVLSPIPDVGGIFSRYKKNNELSFEEIRDKAWRENIFPKHQYLRKHSNYGDI